MKPDDMTPFNLFSVFWKDIDLNVWAVSLLNFMRQCLIRSSGCAGDEIVVWWPDRRRLLLKRGGLSARPRTRAGVIGTRCVPIHVPQAHVASPTTGYAWTA